MDINLNELVEETNKPVNVETKPNPQELDLVDPDLLDSAISEAMAPEYDDDEDEEELSEEEQKAIEQNEVLSNSILKLSSFDNYDVTEFGGQHIKLKRVFDPEGNKTDKFLVFGKVNDGEYKIMNGLLTNRYNFVRLEPFTNHLATQLGIVGSPSPSYSHFRTAWEATLDSSIDVWEGDEKNRLMFSILTGMPDEDLQNMGTSLGVMLTNSCDGRTKLRFSYNLNTTIVDGSGNSNTIVDYFTLTKYSVHLKHYTTINKIISSVQGIQDKVLESVELAKNTKIEDKALIETISGWFKKKDKVTFLGIWEAIPEDMRNMFTLSIVTSVTMKHNWNLDSYFKIRKLMDSYYINLSTEN